MIQLNHISKTYKSKKGNNTKALNNISLNFDKNGMTFILGKSGSGKSTLLNVIGGLDKYDSGDMIILDKSSKDFNQADFDSYRNTYIGFVFQDFNILEDYNVYENIILALQLQQKDINKEEIDTLLEKLELIELKHRKINELSGGQKQRVAIARALVKNPKIILADEPTGNLDSVTGKQVMELLKKISKEKLVVIISHDNESANTYGDRIIEIKDGNIINDIQKQNISVDKKEIYKTIKSKLPLKESFKLGIGSLKHKKIKLFFTIILTMCSLLFLSITDSISNYNVEKAHSKLLVDKKEQYVQIEKYQYEKFDKYDFINKEQLELNEEDTKKIKSKINKNIYPIYKIQEGLSQEGLGTLLKIKTNHDDIPYIHLYESADIVVVDNLNKIIKEKVKGRLPNKANEIVISNYVADIIISNGISTYENNTTNEFITENLYKPKDYNEILNSNKTFYFGNKGKVKIVGIIDYDLSKYQSIKIKEMKNFIEEDYSNYSLLIKNYQNIYNKIYVNESFIDNLDIEKKSILNSNNNYHLISNDIRLQDSGYYVSPAVLEDKIEYYDGTNWKVASNLSKNEMILNVRQIKEFDYDNYQKNLSKYIEKNANMDAQYLEKKFFENYVKDFAIIMKNITLQVYEGRSYNPNKPDYKYDNIKVIGLVGLKEDNSKQYNYFSIDLVGNFKVNLLQKIGYLIPTTEQREIQNILQAFPYNETLSTKTTYSSDVNDLIRTIYILKDIAFWGCIALLIFTIFLIGNFIITSINYRKKEIGVLRALGSRSVDIIKIFLWEGMVMSFISGTLASILLIVVTNLLNKIIMVKASLVLTPFILGARQFIIIYLIVFMVTIISSIIPIFKISKMKPIDAILNK
ncbi:MAG: ABC transporter ATP-binding protein/permease [Bacilli bacterium]